MSTIGDKVFCANCMHCVVIRETEASKDKYILRVSCKKGKWIKRSGEEKLYKYFTVARRTQINCEEYKSMGDSAEFIKNLKRELPIKDEVYLVKEPPSTF